MMGRIWNDVELLGRNVGRGTGTQFGGIQIQKFWSEICIIHFDDDVTDGPDLSRRGQNSLKIFD